MSQLRVLVAQRKSRKGNAAEDARYRRQENKNIRTAEASGHVVVAQVADTVSSQSLPWERRNLRAWFTEDARIAMWDAVLISEVARLSRGDSDTWYEIERWCREHGKYLMDGDGLLWPGPDDKAWDDKRRAARDYWEAVRDAHAEVRADIIAAGGALGRPPFGYRIITREDGFKAFDPHPDLAPVATEIFTRIARGETALSVAKWMTEVTGKPWRVKRVTDMIRRESYLGSRDGHVYPVLFPSSLFDAANAALDARSFTRDSGGPRVVHGYSSVVFCACGAVLHRHQSMRDGRPSGRESYVCSRGYRGIAGEARCTAGPGGSRFTIGFDLANGYVDAEVLDKAYMQEAVMTTTGGDASRQAELRAIDRSMQAAQRAHDMAEVARLAGQYAEVQGRVSEPLRVVARPTGRLVRDAFRYGTLAQRRAILGDYHVVVLADRAVLLVHPENE